MITVWCFVGGAGELEPPAPARRATYPDGLVALTRPAILEPMAARTAPASSRLAVFLILITGPFLLSSCLSSEWRPSTFRKSRSGLTWELVDLHAAELYVGERVQRVGNELLRRQVRTETSAAPLPLPELCVAALKLRQAQQQTDQTRTTGAWIDTGLVFTAVMARREDGLLCDQGEPGLPAIRCFR